MSKAARMHSESGCPSRSEPENAGYESLSPPLDLRLRLRQARSIALFEISL
jgi:hypothetical protein